MAFWPPETQPDSTPLFVAVKIAREAPLLCSPLEKLADPVFTEDTSPLLRTSAAADSRGILQWSGRRRGPTITGFALALLPPH